MPRLARSCLLAIVACAAPSAGAPEAAWPETCRAPAGERTQATLAAGEQDLFGYTLRVSELPFELEGAAFALEVSGPRSRRRLVTGRAPERPCGPYAAPDDPCEEVGIGLFATDLDRRLQAQGLPGGATIDHVEVHDWAEVDRAAEALADALRAWRLADGFRLEVRPMACGEALVETA